MCHAHCFSTFGLSVFFVASFDSTPMMMTMTTTTTKSVTDALLLPLFRFLPVFPMRTWLDFEDCCYNKRYLVPFSFFFSLFSCPPPTFTFSNERCVYVLYSSLSLYVSLTTHTHFMRTQCVWSILLLAAAFFSCACDSDVLLSVIHIHSSAELCTHICYNQIVPLLMMNDREIKRFSK